MSEFSGLDSLIFYNKNLFTLNRVKYVIYSNLISKEFEEQVLKTSDTFLIFGKIKLALLEK